MELRKKRKGFSLVELVVVMAIIGILLVVMAPNYKGFIDSAKNTAVQADARTVLTMLDLYEVKYGEVDGTTTVGTLPQVGLVQSLEAGNLVKFVSELSTDSPLLERPVSELETIVKEGIAGE